MAATSIEWTGELSERCQAAQKALIRVQWVLQDVCFEYAWADEIAFDEHDVEKWILVLRDANAALALAAVALSRDQVSG